VTLPTNSSGGGHDYFHDRLEERGASLVDGVLEGDLAGELKGDLRAVDLVVGSIGESDLGVDQRVAGEDAGLGGHAHAVLDGRNEFLGHRAAEYLVFEGDAIGPAELLEDVGLEGVAVGAGAAEGLDGDRAVAELTATAGLLDVLAARFGFAGDRFFVGDLGLADDDFDLHVAGELVAQDFQVQLAHAGNDGLAGFFIVVGAEGWVFALERSERFAQLLLIGGGLGLDRHADDGLGEGWALEEDRMIGGRRACRR